ncbi:hypothetical protein [Pseudacidovorax intermedius]|uniref:hypothetical protein n=1 Tax=Pseudacidovorax intermedius TaxID=433924 RepID=UPI0012DCD6B8|nr:hypothetical protein [Pseudacidovorax intermedius]
MNFFSSIIILLLIDWTLVAITSLLLGAAYGMDSARAREYQKELVKSLNKLDWMFPLKIIAIIFFFFPLSRPVVSLGIVIFMFFVWRIV